MATVFVLLPACSALMTFIFLLQNLLNTQQHPFEKQRQGSDKKEVMATMMWYIRKKGSVKLSYFHCHYLFMCQ